jgi:DGQHR domain-containing protein
MIDSVNPTVQIPAVQGQFGKRLATYTTQFPAGAIETILGHDPRSKFWEKLPDDLSNIYKHLQRVTKKARLESIVRYIRHRFIAKATICGAFPAISIAVQSPTLFEPFQVSHKGVGVLHFDLSRRNRRIVVDGLGRASAALQLVEWAEDMTLSEEARVGLTEIINEFQLPTVLYLPAPGQPPLSLEEMQQLFHDFNFRVTPVTAREAIALDHSDPYIRLANDLGKSELIQRLGGMELRAASLGKKSTAIIVQQNMVRFVRAATEGEAFIAATTNAQLANPKLTPDTMDNFRIALVGYLDALVRSMGETKFKDREALHLTAPGWAALGTLFHDVMDPRQRHIDLDEAAVKIGSIDWHRSAPEWAEIAREKENADGEKVIGLAAGGGQTRRFITRRLRNILGIAAPQDEGSVLIAEDEAA